MPNKIFVVIATDRGLVLRDRFSLEKVGKDSSLKGILELCLTWLWFSFSFLSKVKCELLPGTRIVYKIGLFFLTRIILADVATFLAYPTTYLLWISYSLGVIQVLSKQVRGGGAVKSYVSAK